MASPTTRVVVVGASGMLGSALVRRLAEAPGIDVVGTVRDLSQLPSTYREAYAQHLVDGVDVLDPLARWRAIEGAEVVVNAVGVVKQASGLSDSAGTVEANALLPHRLAEDCATSGARLVHVSTDCVFSGRRGGYSERDLPDPADFYGRSKLLGEVDAPALTLRTSIIGHELRRHASLVDWFLTRPETSVRGFVNAVYTGVTTDEFARLLVDVVLPDTSLTGLYQVASQPISKFELLRLVAEEYAWGGEIVPDEELRCDRSLSAERFTSATGYRPPPWPEMIHEMSRGRPEWAVGGIRGKACT